jgi:hypothetical protein
MLHPVMSGETSNLVVEIDVKENVEEGPITPQNSKFWNVTEIH